MHYFDSDRHSHRVTAKIFVLACNGMVQYLRAGDAQGKAQAAGSMGEAVEHSFQYLTNADLNAIATFMRTVPAIHDPADQSSRFTFGRASSDLGVLRGRTGIRTDGGVPTGGELFQGNCASCHAPSGQVGNYLLERYGRPGIITAEQVAEVRRGGPSSSLVTLARVGVATAVGAVALIVIFFVIRTRKRSTRIAWTARQQLRRYRE